MIEVFAALALGVAASGHCAAMCGPLMVAWRQHGSGRPAWRHLVLYHGGRIGMYAALGLAAGLVGETVATGGFPRALSIAAGGALVTMAAGRLGIRLPGRLGSGPAQALGRALARLRSRDGAHPWAGAIVAGGINALLPCGLLYAALTAAAAVADPIRAALSMVAYGLGTTPPLLAVWWSAGAVSRVGRRRLAFLSPAVLVITGVVLIVRGVGPAHLHTAVTAAASSAHGAIEHSH